MRMAKLLAPLLAVVLAAAALAGGDPAAELAELQQWYPETAQRIIDLQREIWDEFPWTWEGEPPAWYKDKKKGQSMMFDMAADAENMPLCQGCVHQHEANEDA